MSEHDELRDWDAAYLLGSLSTDDRRRYERHLADCEECASSMAELAGMPGLLGKVPAADADDLLERVPPQAPDLMPQLAGHVARGRSQKRRRVRRWAVALAVAAAVAAGAIGAVVVPGLLATMEPEPASVALELERVTPSPLVASIRLVEEQWGTLVEMECRYDAGDPYSEPVEYAMYVTDDAGDEVRVATWSAAPGQTVTPSGTASVGLAEIRSVEVRSVADGTVLLRGTP
ncbi:anti-sigma factor family protein [Homoserinimonas sp. A520]